MSRFMLAGLALAISLPMAPAFAQSYEGYSDSSSSITVTAPHARRVGRGTTGAPIVMHEAAQTVDYSDLDLRTSYDRERLRHRVDVAAYQACAALDDFPTAYDAMMEPSDCHADAMRRADMQVRDVIAAANGY